MAENLGVIKYDIAVTTGDMLKAETVVDKSTTNIANDFKKIDAAAKNTNTQMTKAAAGVKKGVQANLGQAGIQVQQFVGQLQGGQSAMVALAQQSADLGIVLGAPLVGVFVSLAAVLAGTLAPAIFGSVSNLEKLEKAIENTKAVMTVGKNGIAEYTEEMKLLETASASLAKIKISLAITENNRALKESSKEFKALRADLFNFQEDSSEAAERLTGMTDKTGAVLDLASSLQAFSNAITDEDKLRNLDSIEKALLSMRNADGSFPTKELAEFAQNFFSISDATRQVIASNKALNESNAEMSEQVENNGEAFKDLRISMREQIIALEQGERAAYKYSLLMSGNFTPEQIRAAMKLYDTRQELIKNKEETEEATKANERYADSVRKKTESDLEWYESQLARANQANKKETEQGRDFAQGIIERGMSEPERLAAEIEELKALRADDLENQQLYNDAIAASYEQRNKAVEKSNKQQQQSQALFNDSQSQLLSSLGGLFGAFADNMEVQDKESFEKKKKFQTAQALLNTAMAISNALAAAPPPINFALAAVSGAMGAIQVSAIQNQNYSGGREFGGPVSAGSMYRVGEKGKPEFYKDNMGRLSMIPGENGEVIPANKMSGGESLNNYNVNFNMEAITDDAFKQMAIRNADMFVSIIKADKNNRGEEY